MNSSRFCLSPSGDFAGNTDDCYWGLPSISADDPAFPQLGYWRGYARIRAPSIWEGSGVEQGGGGTTAEIGVCVCVWFPAAQSSMYALPPPLPYMYPFFHTRMRVEHVPGSLAVAKHPYTILGRRCGARWRC